VDSTRSALVLPSAVSGARSSGEAGQETGARWSARRAPPGARTQPGAEEGRLRSEAQLTDNADQALRSLKSGLVCLPPDLLTTGRAGQCMGIEVAELP
ncbi:hypothetical protein MUK42_32686, partial [Musa troglodytarum]